MYITTSTEKRLRYSVTMRTIQYGLVNSAMGQIPCSTERISCLPVKFNVCRKKSAAKFLCVKTSSGIVVATSFLYLTVHRRIAGDVPIYLKFALKVTHLFRKRSFRHISLNSISAVRASDKTFNYHY